jgi:hypothetical protein
MQTDRRLTILESNLKGKEKLLLWLKKAQAMGGFFDHCRSARGPLLIEDEETACLFNLVNRCNGEILEITASPVVQLFALYLIRLALSQNERAHEVEVQAIPALLQSIVLEGLTLDSAIQSICKDHFGGHQVLFYDMQEKISQTNEKRARLWHNYNQIAPRIGLSPIEEGPLQSSVATKAAQKIDEMIRLSRAKATADFGNLHAAYELLFPIIEPTTSTQGSAGI